MVEPGSEQQSVAAVRAARAEFFESAAGMSPYLAVEIQGQTFFVAANGSELQRLYFVNQAAKDIQCLGRAVPHLSMSMRDVFVDVGANIGTTTVTALTQH